MRKLFVLAFAACGTEPPAPAPDAIQPEGQARFASATTIEATLGSTTVSIPPTNEGDQIFVMLGGDFGGVVDSVHAGTRNVSLENGGIMPDACDRWAWTWHSGGVEAGIDTISIDLKSETGSASGYVLVFGGLEEQQYNHATAFSRASSSPAKAPALHTHAGTVVLSLIGSCESVSTLVEPSLFTALPSHDGLGIAYLIPSESGSYGAVWSSTGEGYVSVTRLLR